MKQFKRRLAFLLAVITVAAAIPVNAQAATKKGTVKSVTITKPDTKTLVLKKGKTYKLKTKILTTGKASKKVTFTSSNKKVVKVGKTGKIKAVKKGSAKITVKSTVNKKKKAVLKVIVGTPVSKVKLNKTSLKLTAGKKAVLKASVTPKKPSVKKVKFTSSDKKIAKVSSNGTVTAISAGKATITAKATDGSGKKAVCKVTVESKKQESGTENPKPENPKPEEPKPENPDQDIQLSYEGYDLKWQDEFEGAALNREDWNVELHEPGWVNQEWQEYVDSEENIYVKDGNLVLKPVKKTVDGKDVYTSGRVNTQGKHDFTYGLFEVRAKVPAGKGYLPAFWMMPTDENLYGQWPRCGEIDIMEVMGQENDKLYGTIHYGEPHAESQGTKKLEKSNFSDEYHTFSCEWEPGSIKWYVDGVLYHEENDWFSATEGQGTVAYPAPFDQPFYMILNLAVGGSWVGYPDENTEFENQAYVIDYVKAYQKTEGYDDSNVTKPEKPPVTLRDPDAEGNYANNSNFSVKEDLSDEVDWQFMTALGGEAEAAIVDDSQMGSAIKIETANKGTVDYSVQLVQHKVPLKQGAKYKLTFDAYAAEARTLSAGIGAIGDRSWKKYVNSEVSLTTEKQTYSCEFNMSDEDYENARIEFNMGNIEPAAAIYISNVKLEKTGEFEIDNSKTVRADGNYVYNGSFQEGADRMEYWETADAGGKADISVTGLSDGRRLKAVTANCSSVDEVLLKQTELPLTPGKYELSFDAELKEPAAGDAADIAVTVAGGTQTFTLNKDEKKQYTYKFEIAAGAVIADIDDIIFELGVNGTVLLDNIRLVEDTLIKNGSFNAGFAGYEPYADNSAKASWVVDSQSEDNAADFSIEDTGDADWKIQLKQNNIPLKEGQWYRLSFDVKSSIARKIMYAVQRDGSKHNDDWTPYVQNIISLEAGTENYTPVSAEFQMKSPDDPEAVLSISMGAVDGTQITQKHRICLDNFVLEEIEAPEIPDAEAGENILANADFSDADDSMKGWTETIANWENGPGAQAERSISEGSVTYNITNVGTEDWNVQLKQSGLALKAGEKYKVTFKISSTEARSVKSGVMSTAYNWYGGSTVVLEKGTEQKAEYEFTMSEDDAAADFFISMGQIADDEGNTIDTPASVITIKDISIIKVAE